MEVQLTADQQAKLDALSGETGRSTQDFVRDALAGYLDEVTQLRELLDKRYEDLKHGRVTAITSAEVRRHFEQRVASLPS